VPVPAATSPITNAAAHLAVDGLVAVSHAAFVFAPNFGQPASANFAVATDTIQFRSASFLDTDVPLPPIHSDGQGNAMTINVANDMLTIEDIAAEQSNAHHHDFHLI
jgi:hypothetical protein